MDIAGVINRMRHQRMSMVQTAVSIILGTLLSSDQLCSHIRLPLQCIKWVIRGCFYKNGCNGCGKTPLSDPGSTPLDTICRLQEYVAITSERGVRVNPTNYPHTISLDEVPRCSYRSSTSSSMTLFWMQ